MSISSRIHDTIEDWQAEWKDRLRGWALRTVGEGITKALEDMEPGAIDSFKAAITKIRDNPLTPPEMVAFYNKALVPGNWLTELIAGLTMAIGAIPALLGAGVPLGNLIKYGQDKELKSFRLDPIAVIAAWRRDPEKYAYLFDDLKDQGWSDERIEALKFYTLVWPSRQDLQRYVAKEALEPEAISKYGLMDEFDRLDLTMFDQIGVSRETARLDWIAHWEHASWMQVVEMLHRGLLSESEVWDWFRLVEIPPFWRQPLIDSAYTWPTRVDVRRWWDMRTIDEPELRRLYSGMGYRGVNLDNYVLWTKVYVAFPDLMARWTKGWITIDDVRSQLIALGMPAARVEEMIQMKIKPEEPARVEDGKELTKTEIYKGVKKELIDWEQGIELLIDLGYDYEEADYILSINVGVLEGSPETFEEFKAITQKYKIASGKEARPMTEELKAAAAEVVRLTDEVKSLERSVEKEKRKLIKNEVVPTEQTKKLTELQVSLHRAESELARVKSEYNSQLAEWRHG